MKTKLCLLLVLVLIATSSHAETNAVASGVPVATDISIKPTNLAQLLALPPEQLDKVDIARINLLCTEGLPGTENMDVPQLLKTLDSWAQWVSINTQRHHYRFENNPMSFRFSEGDFRMAFLSATLQQQYGVLYDPARAEPQLRSGPYAESDEIFFANPSSIFIHGLLSGKHYGTCSSMPILFVAVAQRLGYPVHLAMSQGHLIVRYEEGTNHFNVEATSPGYSVYDDEHYKQWPFAITDEEAKNQHYFQPMTGREILAVCLDSRSACFNAAGEFEKSREAALAAHKLAPYVKEYQTQADHLADKIENNRNAEKWDALLAEIQKVVPPDGDKLGYFRDKTIDLQIYLFRTADMDGTAKALDELKKEVAAAQPVDMPQQIKLSPLKPDPGFTVQVVVMPEKAQYITTDGQTIETLVKSPEQLAEFFIEQRIFDKVEETDRRRLEVAGISGVNVPRPSSINLKLPPGMLREERLKMIEAELDEKLAILKEEAPTAPDAMPGVPPEIQAAIQAAEAGNSANRQPQGVPNLSLPNLPQLENLK